MKLLRTIATLAMAFVAGSAGAQVLNETLNFDDNAVPSGWTFQDVSSGNHNVGIANGRFYSDQIDSAAYLRRDYTPNSGAMSLRVTWEGSVFETFWGNHQVVSLKNAAAETWSVGAWSKNVYFGSGIRFFTTDENQHYSDLVDYNYQHGNFQSGIYSFTATFSDGLISFSGALNGSTVFDFNTVVAGFMLADQRNIELDIAETTGQTQWMDNVSIQETAVAAIPEPETYAMLLAGLGLLGFAARRRKLKEAVAA
jgi:hypothetical protein